MTVQASAVRRRLAPDQAVERQALESGGGHRSGGAGGDAPDGRGPAGPGDGPGAGAAAGTRARSTGWSRSSGRGAAGLGVGDRDAARELAPGLDLTAYRLVQEGLTNTLRHARNPQRAEVAIDYRGDRIELAVRDDGQPAGDRGPAR